MNKFLLVSGVFFWVQIAVLGCYGLHNWYSFDIYQKEAVEFSGKFTSDLLIDRSRNRTSDYFSGSLEPRQINLFYSSLEKLGSYGDCKYNITVELPEPTALMVGDCVFQNSKATIDLQLVKVGSSWLVESFQVISDIFVNDL